MEGCQLLQTSIGEHPTLLPGGSSEKRCKLLLTALPSNTLQKPKSSQTAAQGKKQSRAPHHQHSHPQLLGQDSQRTQSPRVTACTTGKPRRLQAEAALNMRKGPLCKYCSQRASQQNTNVLLLYASLPSMAQSQLSVSNPAAGRNPCMQQNDTSHTHWVRSFHTE